MRMMTLLLTGLMWASMPAQALEIAGVKLADTERAGETMLQLNGAGVRSRLLFKVYVAALYLPARQTRADAVLAAPPPRRMQLVMLRDLSADTFSEALHKGLSSNASAPQLAALAPRLAEFDVLLKSQGEAREGAVYTLDDTPAGMQLSVNGKPIGKPIVGADFFRALLSVWLGEHPVQADLKRALLGER
jgi:hypothetical protein